MNVDPRELEDKIQRLERALEVRGHELEHARRINNKTMKILVGIHAMCVGPDVRVGDKTLHFICPNANEMLHELSNRIRAIPNELDSIIEKGDEW